MTWGDILLIVSLFVFAAAGARMGSLWTGACLIGGFLGAFLADYYALGLADWLGGFSGAVPAAAVLLFIVGAAAALIPGYLLSRLSSAMFLGLIDSAFGILTGLFAGCLAISLFLLLIVPTLPRIEKSKVWKDSAVLRPLHGFLEEAFSAPQFRPETFSKRVRKKTMKKISSEAEKAVDSLKKEAQKGIEKAADKILE